MKSPRYWLWLMLAPLAMLGSAFAAVIGGPGTVVAFVLFAVGVARLAVTASHFRWTIRILIVAILKRSPPDEERPPETSVEELGEEVAEYQGTLIGGGPTAAAVIGIHVAGIRILELIPGDEPVGRGRPFLWQDVVALRPCVAQDGSTAILVAAGARPSPWVIGGSALDAITAALEAAGVARLEPIDLRPEDWRPAPTWADLAGHQRGAVLGTSRITGMFALAAMLFAWSVFSSHDPGQPWLGLVGLVTCVGCGALMANFLRDAYRWWRNAERRAART